MNARRSLLALNRCIGTGSAQVRVARDRCDIAELPQEITDHAAGMFADDPPGHG